MSVDGLSFSTQEDEVESTDIEFNSEQQEIEPEPLVEPSKPEKEPQQAQQEPWSECGRKAASFVLSQAP